MAAMAGNDRRQWIVGSPDDVEEHAKMVLEAAIDAIVKADCTLKKDILSSETRITNLWLEQDNAIERLTKDVITCEAQRTVCRDDASRMVALAGELRDEASRKIEEFTKMCEEKKNDVHEFWSKLSESERVRVCSRQMLNFLILHRQVWAREQFHTFWVYVAAVVEGKAEALKLHDLRLKAMDRNLDRL